MRAANKTITPWQKQLLLFAPFIMVGVIMVLLPPFLPMYLVSMMTKVCIFAIFASSLNLIMGYGGLPSLGHAAFFGMGGYTVAVLMLHFNTTSLWISAPLGILMAALFGAIFGFIVLRVSGFYFILVTFALGQLLFSVAWKLPWLSTQGIEGIPGIKYPDLGIPWFAWSPLSFYYFVFLAFAICFFLIRRLIKSPFGYALQGIREREPRMQTLGYNTWLYKYIAFVVAAAFAGVAGVLFAYHSRIVVPEHLGVSTSALAMLMVILGGAGTLYGPAIGAALIIPLEFYSGLITPERWPLILGSIFVITIMYARQGIGVYLSRFWMKVVQQYGSIKS